MMTSDESKLPDPLGDVPTPIDLNDPIDAKNWANQAEGRPHRKPFRARFAELVQQRSSVPRRVLELGAGPGWLAEKILSEVEVAEYVLFDFSKPMLDMARKRLARFAPARFVQASFKESDWPAQFAEPFDAVLAMQSVHELRHKRHHLELFRKVRSTLVPGGIFAVADGGPLAGIEPTTRLYATPNEEAEWLEAAGFEDIRLEASGTYERAPGRISTMYLLSGRVGDR